MPKEQEFQHKPIVCSVCGMSVCNGKFTTPDGKIWTASDFEKGIGSVQVPVICRICIGKGVTL